MPDNTVSSFQEAQQQIAIIRGVYQKLRDEFLADGVIDQTEQDELDRLGAKIAMFEERLTSGGGTSSPEEITGAQAPAASISASVGQGAQNTAEDVTAVQQLLNQNGASLKVDGLSGGKTIGAIAKFQRDTLGFQDGRVDPDGQTWNALSGGPVGGGVAEPAGGGGTGPAGGGVASPSEDPTIGGGPEGGGNWDSEGETIPDEQERRIREIVEEQIPGEVPIIVDGDGNDPLASPEIPFARNQEITVSCPFGEISVKFNDRGQVETASMAVPGIPGVTAAVGAYGILGKLEVKPYTGKLMVSKPGGNLKLDIELSASGSGFMGLGLGKGDAWGGIGIDIEVKVSRTQTITAEIALDLLEEMIKSPSPVAGASVAFSLPAEIVLNGSQSLVIGGSAPKGLVGITSKFTLKDYSPMATLKVSESNGKLTCEFKTYDGLKQMAEDVSRRLLPPVEAFYRYWELAQDVQRMRDDPEKFAEEKIQQLEELKRKLLSLAPGLEDLIDEEIAKINKLCSEIRDQLDEWAKDGKEAYDRAEDYLEEKLEEAEDYFDEKLEEVDDLADDTKDFLEEQWENAEEALEDAEEYFDEKVEEIDEALDNAEEYLDDKVEEVDEALEDAEEYLDDKVEEAEDYLEEKYEEAEEVYEDAEEAYDDAKDAVEDKAKELWKDAKDFF